jgi:hypothetical protein
VPRPRLRASRHRPRLTDVVVSSDLTPRYLGAWDVTRRMWSEVAGLSPHLVLIAEAAEVPPALVDDPLVHVFEPIPGLHTAMQAQCIRLLYPALLDTEGAVLISDVDMVPLNRRYFHELVEQADERHFVAYRDVLLSSAQIPICYNAALPSVWADVFDVRAPEDVRRKLSEWGEGLVYDGRHSGHGWLTDQLILYETLLRRGREHRDVWILRDTLTGFERLLRRHAPLEAAERDGIRRGIYADFHIRIPYDEHRALNDEVVGLALAGRG